MSQSIDEVLLGTPASRRGSGGSGDYEGEGEGEGDKFVRQLFESLLLGTRASNAIPDGEGQEDYAYNATFPEFRSRAEGCGKQVLELIQIFLNHVRQDGEFGLPEVGDAGDPEVFQGIADIVEALLEDVDSYLDDASGKGANQQVTLMRHQLQTVASAARSGPHKYATMMANVADISKPQEAFQDEIDNDRNTPFVPRLREKPNAVTPLDLSPIPNMSASMGMGTEVRDDSALGGCGLDFRYPHPYEAEIRTFHYMPGQVQAPDPSFLVRPESLDDDDALAATFVDTVEALDAMIAHIVGNDKGGNTSSGSSDDDEGGGVGGGRGSGTRRACREIAVDLEAHSVRSFQGVVCLVQMSTRERDFIVDPLKLRAEMTRLLGVFTDPGIVKVLHGSDQDILWLQRDLGLYVVNMFDTGQAARQLGLPSFGLAHLLQVFCDFTADKTHQLSDWRKRPLPADMLKYAQGDTHYLLYVYDRLRADLERAGGELAIKSVLDASREICLRRYEKPMFRERGWAAMLRRQGELIRQEYGEDSGRILSALWEWRDAVARSEDESTGYVMPFPVMLRIAKKLPSTRDELESCAHPLSSLVRRKAEEVLTIVENAKNGIEPMLDTTHGHLRTPAISGATAAAASTVPSSATPRMPPGSGGVLGGVAGPSRTFNPVSSAEPYFRPYNVTPSGASQFVLSEGSRGSPSPLLVHQSPVLNTEELYRAAGWMTPLPKDARLGDDGQDDDEGEERDADGDPRSINSSSNGLVSLAAKNDQLDTSQRMGHSMALGGISGAPGTGGVEAAPGPGEAGVRTADRIRDEIAREPVLSLRNLDGFGDEEGGAAGKGHDGSDAEGGSSSGEEEVGLEPGGEESLDEPGIPKSIAEIYEISNRNRRRNKKKKKLRETASEVSTSSPTSRTTQPYQHQHPHQQLQHHQQQQQPGGRVEGGSDSATGFATALESPAAEGPAASYFSGRKRQKGDAPGQGLGLLVDRNRRGPGAGDGRGIDEDTMEFMEDLGWITPEQREALSQQHSPSSGPSTSAGDGSAAPLCDRSLIGSANGVGNPGGDGLGGGDPGDGYTRAGTGGARSRGSGRQGGPGAVERGGGLRGPGPTGRGGGGGRGKGGTPKRDRDGGRGSGAGIGVGRGPAGGVQPPAFRGYDLGQVPPSMGAYHAQGQRDGGSGGGGNGRGSGVFNPFLAPQGVVGASAGMGGTVPGGSVQRGYGGGRQQQQAQQQQQQQQSQHWRPRPDTEKTKSITYGAPSTQGVGSGRGGGGGNGSRRGR